MKLLSNKKKSFSRTAILVSLFLLLLVSYLNMNYLKEKFRAFSFNKESRWSIERNSVAASDSAYSAKEVVKIISPVFHINKVYHSMTGPADVFYMNPDNTPKNDIIWLTDYSVNVLDKDCKTELSQDFLCHNNLDVAFSELLPQRKEMFNNRLIMVAQGQNELHLPSGCGIPLLSHDNISITTESLNHNIINASVDVRHSVVMKFIRNVNLRKPVKPLFKRAINVLAEDPSDVTLRQKTNDTLKRSVYSGKWLAPPGIDTLKFEVTGMMRLPYTTTLHYASVHTYAYCVSLILKDMTSGTTVFNSTIKNFKDRTGIASMDFYSDSKGIEMNATHRYMLTCVTNNTSGKVQDMMAGMILYFYDKEMEKNIGDKFSARN